MILKVFNFKILGASKYSHTVALKKRGKTPKIVHSYCGTIQDVRAKEILVKLAFSAQHFEIQTHAKQLIADISIFIVNWIMTLRKNRRIHPFIIFSCNSCKSLREEKQCKSESWSTQLQNTCARESVACKFRCKSNIDAQGAPCVWQADGTGSHVLKTSRET